MSDKPVWTITAVLLGMLVRGPTQAATMDTYWGERHGGAGYHDNDWDDDDHHKPTTTTTRQTTTTTRHTTTTTKHSTTTTKHSTTTTKHTTTTTKPTTTTTSTTSTTTTTTSTTTTSTSTTTTTTTPSTTTTTLAPHFQCYEIKPAAFAPVPVSVQDQFGMLQGSIRFPHRLCAVADKNGERIADPTEHLTGYTFKVPFTKRLNQTTVDQFGTLELDVVRSDLLMIPTAKNGVPVAPPPSDHFACYKVKRSPGGVKFAKRTVTVADQFETVTLELQKPALLCAPASKNGEDPTAPTHPDHLVCYKARSKTRFGTIDVDIDNQFGPDQVTLIHRRELCVPALKNPDGGFPGAFLGAASQDR